MPQLGNGELFRCNRWHAASHNGVFDRLAFARDGFGVVRGAIPQTLVTALGKAFQRVQASVSDLPPHLLERLTLERDLTADKRGGAAASEVGDAIFILGDPVAFDEAFWTLLDLPTIVDTVREAVGVHDVAAHFMNVTTKHAGFGRSIGWHRDFPNRYACPKTPCFVRLMVCLDGMSDTMGATAFVPGSHRLDDAAARTLFQAGGQKPSPLDPVVPAHCDPGDLVVIHPKVLHGGGRNTSPQARRNIVLQAGDAEAPMLTVPDREGVAGRRLGLPLDKRMEQCP